MKKKRIKETMATNESSICSDMPSLSFGDELFIPNDSMQDGDDPYSNNSTHSVLDIKSKFNDDLSTSVIEHGVNTLSLAYDSPILNLDDGITMLTNIIEDGERISARKRAKKASTMPSKVNAIAISDHPFTATNDFAHNPSTYNKEDGINNFEIGACKLVSNILDSSSKEVIENSDSISTAVSNFDYDNPDNSMSTSSKNAVNNLTPLNCGPNTAVSKPKKKRVRSVKRKDVKVKVSVIKKIKPTGEVWTTEERRKLYFALCKYGDADIKKLTACVGSRTLNDVAAKISHYETVASRRIRDEMKREPDGKYKDIRLCGEWIRKLQALKTNPIPAKSTPLAIAFKIIELYEKHPDPKDAHGIDFQKVYGWMSDCISGNPTRDLDIPTASFLLKFFQVLMDRLNKAPSPEMEEKLKVVKTIIESLQPRKRHKMYSYNKNTKNEKIMNAIMFSNLIDDGNINPLGLPPEFWKSNQ